MVIYCSNFCKLLIKKVFLFFVLNSETVKIEMFVIFESSVSIFFGAKASSNCNVMNSFFIFLLMLKPNFLFQFISVFYSNRSVMRLFHKMEYLY